MELHPVQQADVQQLVQLLSLGQQSSKDQQALLFSALSQVEKNPSSYPAFLSIALEPSVAMPTRELAALTLKNMLTRNSAELPPTVATTLKALILGHFGNTEPAIAKMLGLVLGVLVESSQSASVDYSILEFLLEHVKAGNAAALDVLGRVIEDLRGGGENNGVWESVKFSKYLEHLIQVLLQLCGTHLKPQAMHCLNLLISKQPVALLPHLSAYVRILIGSLGGDAESGLKAMEGLSEISEQRKDLLSQEMIKAVASTHFTGDKLRKTEFSFWLEVIDSEENDAIVPFLPQLLPKFIAALEWTAEDEASHIQTENYHLERVDNEDGANHEASEEDLGADDDDQAGKGGAFTMRKRAGNIISKLAMHFPEGLWQKSQPLLSQVFAMSTWEKCQIGVLYIGLIYEFCKNDINSHIGEIIKLISGLLGRFPGASQLRATSFWTFSNFSQELIKLAESNPKALEDYLSLLLANLEPSLAPNVKQSVCSAISKLVENGPEVMRPAYTLMISRLAVLLEIEKGETLFSVYDTIARLVESMPQNIKSQDITHGVLVALCKKWSSMKETDMNICPIIECLTEVTSSLKAYLAPYSLELFQKALLSFKPGLKQPVLRLSDLLCNLLQKPTPELIMAVKSSNLLQTVYQFIGGKDRELKQFSYSLLNHIVKYVGLDDPQTAVQVVSASVETNSEALSNNALFCLVGIMKKYGLGRDVAENMYKLAFGLLQKMDTTKKIYQINFSKVIGILVLMYTKQLAPQLHNYGRLCFSGIKSEFKDDHMVDAYKGLLSAVILNPGGMFDNIIEVVTSYLYFKAPTAETDSLFRQVLAQYTQSAGLEGLEKLKIKMLPAAALKLNAYLS